MFQTRPGVQALCPPPQNSQTRPLVSLSTEAERKVTHLRYLAHSNTSIGSPLSLASPPNSSSLTINAYFDQSDPYVVETSWDDEHQTCLHHGCSALSELPELSERTIRNKRLPAMVHEHAQDSLKKPLTSACFTCVSGVSEGCHMPNNWLRDLFP